MKENEGQALIVGAVLMIIVILVVVSGVMIFGTDTIENVFTSGEEEIERRVDKTRATIAITSLHTNSEEKVEIRNIGKVEIPVDFNVYLNGTLYDIDPGCSDQITTAENCNLTVQGLDSDSICNYDVKVNGPYETWDRVEAGSTC